MPLLVRSWNVFHGRTSPPTGPDLLEEAVRLAASDRPDVLCLQELPAWALSRLETWTRMSAVGAIAQMPRLGPLPITARLGRALSDLHTDLRWADLTGQANAVLVAPSHRPLGRWTLELNDRRFRRAQARWLRLGTLERLAWARERRVCLAVRLRLADGRLALVASLHASSLSADQRIPDAETLRAAAFADALAEPEEIVVLAGDVNVTAARSRTLSDLAGPEWGFSPPGPGIDQILVRGAKASPLQAWPPERRRHNGRLLSDHSPVELTIE